MSPGPAGPAWELVRLSVSQAPARPTVSESVFWKDPPGFPGSPVAKNPPANAEDSGSIPVRKLPHAEGQLSP